MGPVADLPDPVIHRDSVLEIVSQVPADFHCNQPFACLCITWIFTGIVRARGCSLDAG